MVLSFLGHAVSYDDLYARLGTRWFGTPAANILHLTSFGVDVSLDELDLDAIATRIQTDIPVIAFISTADLPYWNVDTDHAVVVIGVNDEKVYLNDPYHAAEIQTVSHAQFSLAQLRFNNLCAVTQNP
jgi:ABC-type bacteriocin/lantibiotic exporter with double-glycine peptidase domain